MRKSIRQAFSLNDENSSYLDLWKWFTDDGAKVKDRMWVLTSFFFSLLSGLLAYIAENMIQPDIQEQLYLRFENPAIVLIVAIIGVIVSCYSLFMLYQYGKHIRLCWNRADYIRFRIKGLSEIWCFNNDELEKLDRLQKNKMKMSPPPVAQYMMIFMVFFFLIFTGLLVWMLLV